MTASLVDRVVLITGGLRGLGLAMAEALTDAGARLSLTGAPLDGGGLVELEASDRVLRMRADVRDLGHCQELTRRTLDLFGRIDVLINNAGRGMGLISPAFTREPAVFWKSEPSAWRAILETNVLGAYNMAHCVAPRMIERGFGKIVNISTSAQTMVRKGYSPYGPSKAALEAASRVWAEDLAGTGVDVNVFLPGGAVDTDIVPPGPNRAGADGLLLDPAIMKPGILWLCSDASNGRSGERFIARLWDQSLSPDDAADAARSPHVAEPKIM